MVFPAFIKLYKTIKFEIYYKMNEKLMMSLHADRYIHMISLIIPFMFFINQYSFAQKKSIKPFVGIYFTGDAAMEFIGPSFILGQEISISDRVDLVPYVQYFQANYEDSHNDSFETGLIAIMAQVNNYSIKGKGLFWAVGLAYQVSQEKYYNEVNNRNMILPTFRLGYRFLSKKINLNAEITSPAFYFENSRISKLFTLPSIGVRIGV